MECDEVRDRLVALHDDELSPSEIAQTREHLARCPSCARADRRLLDTAPLPPSPPLGAAGDRLRARLAQRLDPDRILELAARPREEEERRPAFRTLWQGLTRAASVPIGVVVVYLALLVASFGWGVSNWWTLSALRAPPSVPASPSGTAIPADQFRPAAYDPSADRDGN